jgi:hypothetical protein
MTFDERSPVSRECRWNWRVFANSPTWPQAAPFRHPARGGRHNPGIGQARTGKTPPIRDRFGPLPFEPRHPG